MNVDVWGGGFSGDRAWTATDSVNVDVWGGGSGGERVWTVTKKLQMKRLRIQSI